MKSPCRTIPFKLIEEFVQDYLAKRALPVVRDANASLPIIWFGDSRSYFSSKKRIVTIGLNPSLKEFSKHRFNTTIDWTKPDAKVRLSETLDQYFSFNPYWSWFRWFEAVLNFLGASYKAGSFTNRAIHIDVHSSLATNPTWGGLDDAIREKLKRTDLFERLVNILKPDIILLSTNDEVRNSLFDDFKLIESAQYEKEDGTIVRGSFVRLYRKDGTFLLTGRNLHGTPFGGLSHAWLNRTLPRLFGSCNRSKSHPFCQTNPTNGNKQMKTTKHVILRAQDKPFFTNIDEICEATGVDPRSVRRGFLRTPGALLPSNPDVYLWWPASNNKNWENLLSNDGKTFMSKSRKKPFSLAGIVEAVNANRRSAVFFRESSESRGYRFIGVFKTNLEKSRERHFHVFDRVSDTLEV